MSAFNPRRLARSKGQRLVLDLDPEEASRLAKLHVWSQTQATNVPPQKRVFAKAMLTLGLTAWEAGLQQEKDKYNLVVIP